MAIWNKVFSGVLACVLAFGGLRAANGIADDEKKTAAVDIKILCAVSNLISELPMPLVNHRQTFQCKEPGKRCEC